MLIPQGMTEEEVMGTIELVIGRMAARYKFYGFEVEDIEQEAFILCMDALTRYNPKMPLENFLASHLSKRLKNLIRDNHFNSGDSENKKNIKMPGQLSNEGDMYYYESFTMENLDIQELTDIIDRELPYEYRENYLKMINGVSISKKDQEEIITILRAIAEENGYEQ